MYTSPPAPAEPAALRDGDGQWAPGDTVSLQRACVLPGDTEGTPGRALVRHLGTRWPAPGLGPPAPRGVGDRPRLRSRVAAVTEEEGNASPRSPRVLA